MVPAPNEDTVSQLEFSKFGDPLLVSSGWDSTLRVWEFTDWAYQRANFKLWCVEANHDAILRFTFNSDYDTIYYGTSGGELKCLDLSGPPSSGFGGVTSGSAFGASVFAPKTNAAATNTFVGNQGASNTGIGKGTGLFGSQTSGTGGFGGFQSGFSLGNTGGTNGTTQSKALAFPVKDDYMVSGLKWSDNHKLVVTMTSNKSAQFQFEHSIICTVDPADSMHPQVTPIEGKIVKMDCVDDIVWVAMIKDGNFYICYMNLNAPTRELKPLGSHIQSLPTDIAGLTNGICGMICSTIQGFVELYETSEQSLFSGSLYQAQTNVKHLYEPVFREESPNRMIVYPSNSVAVCQMDKKMAMASGRNEIAFFDLETGNYITKTPQTKNNDPITACAFSPSGDVFACAQGYDWHEGAEYMNKHKPHSTIFVGKVPDVPKDNSI